MRIAMVLSLAFTMAAFSAMQTYGNDAVSSFDHSACSVYYFTNVADVRSSSRALYVAGFISLFAGVFAHKTETDKDDSQRVAFVADLGILVGVLSIVVSGLLSMIVVFSGTCTHGVGDIRNNSNDDIKVYAAVVLSLCLMQAYLKIGISPIDFRGPLHPTCYINFADLSVRIILSGMLTALMSSTGQYFKDNYSDIAKADTYACLLASTTTSQADLDRFKPIRIAEIKGNGTIDIVTSKPADYVVEVNQAMAGYIYSVIAALAIEAIMRKLESDEKIDPKWEYLSRTLALYSDLALSIFMYSLFMENSIMACTLLKADNDTIEWIYIMFSVYVLINTVTVFTIYKTDTESTLFVSKPFNDLVERFLCGGRGSHQSRFDRKDNDDNEGIEMKLIPAAANFKTLEQIFGY